MQQSGFGPILLFHICLVDMVVDMVVDMEVCKVSNMVVDMEVDKVADLVKLKLSKK